MYNNLNLVLNELKLTGTNLQPNLNEILAQVKTQEINYHRSKVISISRTLLENANDGFQQAQLNLSLYRLDTLLTA